MKVQYWYHSEVNFVLSFTFSDSVYYHFFSGVKEQRKKCQSRISLIVLIKVFSKPITLTYLNCITQYPQGRGFSSVSVKAKNYKGIAGFPLGYKFYQKLNVYFYRFFSHGLPASFYYGSHSQQNFFFQH